MLYASQFPKDQDEILGAGLRYMKPTFNSYARELNVDYRRLVDQYHYDPSTGRFTYRLPNPWIRTPHRGRTAEFITGRYKYFHLRIDGKFFFAHRIAYLWMVGEPSLHQIDHIDGNSFNNKWKNLRVALHAHNQWNRRISKANTTGYKGVIKSRNKTFIAYVRRYGRTIHIGTFPTAEEAFEARKNAIIHLHGCFARSE